MSRPDEVSGEDVGSLAAAQGSLAAAQGLVAAALEHKPDVKPPADFARRVALLAAAQPQARRYRVPSYARSAALVATVLVAVALFALAPRSAASFGDLAFDLELVILAQLALMSWWMTTQPYRTR